jgi:UDP-glucose 4-epimerase
MKLKGKSIWWQGAVFLVVHLVDRIIKEEPANLVVVDNFFLGRKKI